MNNIEFDVIIVGSGASGATVARELARQDLRVLLLERGADTPMAETLSAIAAVAREFPVGDRMKATTAFTVGGATSIYFGICKLPTEETFDALGIDLAGELEEVRKELPIVDVSDEFLAPQSVVICDSAKQLGYPMKKHRMLIDKSRCPQGHYSYEAKWKARRYIDEAVGNGAVLVSNAHVRKVIVENGRAVGVEYVHKQGLFGKQVCKAYGKKIVLSAGSPASPKLLIDAGVRQVGSRGFFCKPAFMVFGTVPGLKGRDAFVGMTEHDLGNGITIGDGAMTSTLFKLFMLSNLKLTHLFSHATTVSVAVALNDELGGEVTKDGGYHKRLSAEQVEKLNAAETVAVQILQNAGAKNIFRSKMVAGTPGGVLWVGQHVDHNLQTEVANLYVCDQSLVPDVNITPMITLVCLAKRLARHLLVSLQPPATTVAEPAHADAA